MPSPLSRQTLGRPSGAPSPVDGIPDTMRAMVPRQGVLDVAGGVTQPSAPNAGMSRLQPLPGEQVCGWGRALAGG